MNRDSYLTNKGFIIFIINRLKIDVSVKKYLIQDIKYLSFHKHKTLWKTNRYELFNNTEYFLSLREYELDKYIFIYRQHKLKKILNEN